MVFSLQLTCALIPSCCSCNTPWSCPQQCPSLSVGVFRATGLSSLFPHRFESVARLSSRFSSSRSRRLLFAALPGAFQYLGGAQPQRALCTGRSPPCSMTRGCSAYCAARSLSRSRRSYSCSQRPVPDRFPRVPNLADRLILVSFPPCLLLLCAN